MLENDNRPMSNSLINSKSPYLLQHADNPVNWRPWNKDIFAEAKRDNKMLFISIGYAACHWCHVMERESFMNEEIAEILNDYFIPVKVDREERPDIDQIYMNAVQLINRQGGWPLSCFALPDGSPFFGGTYFPPGEFQGILQSLAATWLKERQRILDAAKQVNEGLVKTDIVQSNNKKDIPSEDFLHEYVNSWSFQFDSYWGGNAGAPKFPLPASLDFLLSYGVSFNNKEVLDHVKLTVQKITGGGIFDHVGGGFARYTTDKKWHVPHFEKMLYDNGQLLTLLSNAYRYEQDQDIANAIYKTIDFLKTEMLDTNHGFYSSLDADSEHEEGKYYVWTKTEIEHALGSNAELFCDYFNVTKAGNWENGKNILIKSKTPESVFHQHNKKKKQGEKIIRHSLEKLYEIRSKRKKPATDNKQLVSWNAMTIEGLVNAFQTFQEDEWLNMAKNTGYFLKKHALNNNRLSRNCRKDQHAIPGFLEDYAFTIRAMISLFMTTAEKHWLQTAHNLLKYTIEHFKAPDSALFFQTKAKDAPLGMRKMEIMDNVIPSPNSVMAENLLKMAALDDNMDYKEQASQMIQDIKPKIQHNGPFFAHWMKVYMHLIHPPYEIAVSGPEAENKIRELQKHFLPCAVQVWSNQPSDLPLLQNRYSKESTRIFICRNYTCDEPLEDINKVIDKLKIDVD
ncbi:MAG: thioredoxin domain-containing protein [Bacteroidales bacterium]